MSEIGIRIAILLRELNSWILRLGKTGLIVSQTSVRHLHATFVYETSLTGHPVFYLFVQVLDFSNGTFFLSLCAHSSPTAAYFRFAGLSYSAISSCARTRPEFIF